MTGFKAAQGHANSGNIEHGLRNHRGFDASDLSNLYVGAEATGRIQFFATRLSLRADAVVSALRVTFWERSRGLSRRRSGNLEPKCSVSYMRCKEPYKTESPKQRCMRHPSSFQAISRLHRCLQPRPAPGRRVGQCRSSSRRLANHMATHRPTHRFLPPSTNALTTWETQDMLHPPENGPRR